MTGKAHDYVVAGYVLAGGASSRFGRDKALAKFGDQTVLESMCSLVAKVTGNVAVVAPPHRYDLPEVSTLDDRWPGEGPLGGIITALQATQGVGSCAWNLIVSCDMPFLSVEWLEYMTERAKASETEVVVPQSEHGLEPLCAYWRTSAADKLQGAFDEGVRKVTEAMKRLRMEVLDETHWKRFDSAGRLFWNMNTLQDYDEALRLMGMESK
jgi:molybdopterin-guanine dinucleotide biosynthesis protein A